jgi:hypothetical protein
VTGRHHADAEAALGAVPHGGLHVRLILGQDDGGGLLLCREVPALAGPVVAVVAGTEQRSREAAVEL